MSDNWIQFVPEDPTFQPSVEAAELAKRMLSSFVPNAWKVSASFKDSIDFFHPGGNWSGVECNACGADVENWWPHAMNSAFKTGFSSLQTKCPICGAEVSLNDLKYIWPAAFGSFVLEAMNPSIGEFPDEQLAQLVEVLECKLRKIYVHV